jgi:polysaccharide export outer membrane protein
MNISPIRPFLIASMVFVSLAAALVCPTAPAAEPEAAPGTASTATAPARAASGPAAASQAAAAAQAAQAGHGYRIGPEDVLEITVWKEDGLHKEVLVRPDGGISFPLVGDVVAAGRTALDIQNEITERLKKIINDPVVSVAVEKVTANKLYVIGRVAKPGEFVAGRYVDVLQALSMAGGLTPFAAEDDIKVLRRIDGKEEVYRFSYSDIRQGRRLEQNIQLQGGDVVVVP